MIASGAKGRNMTTPNANYPAYADKLSYQRACRKPVRASWRRLAVLVIAAVALSFARPAAAQTDVERQAQCELSAIRDTRSAIAVQSIRSACNWLVVNGDSLLNASSKGYYVCLVRQLSGAQSDQAAAAIMQACRASNPL
jgi:hypothetical protein